jgi:Asp-tRNA(Asn)/Glu-tRNA(Gln) amidotransferase A subunit family amidase
MRSDRAIQIVQGVNAGLSDPHGHAAPTPLWNHAHCLAISIPCGKDRAGLPVGLQIAGPAGADRRVLSFAAAAEAMLAEAGLRRLP